MLGKPEGRPVDDDGSARLDGVFRQDGEPIRRHVGKTTPNLKHGDLAIVEHADRTFFQSRHERRVTGQDPEVTFGARRINLIHQSREQLALRRDQREMEFIGHQADASAASCSALRTASSMVPTL